LAQLLGQLGVFLDTGLAQIMRLGPAFWLHENTYICMRGLNLANDLGQPCAIFVPLLHAYKTEVVLWIGGSEGSFSFCSTGRFILVGRYLHPRGGS
jgi:hypothetical protein